MANHREQQGQKLRLSGVKIRCDNWYWSRKLQLLLQHAIGCRWSNGIAVPWNTRREFLVVRPSVAGGWFFSWATPADVDACPLPEWSAKALIAAYPVNKQAQAR